VCRSAWRAAYCDGRTSHAFDGGHDLLFVLRGKGPGVEYLADNALCCRRQVEVLLQMFRNFELRVVRDLRVPQDPADEDASLFPTLMWLRR
jgi:hypothetical protein